MARWLCTLVAIASAVAMAPAAEGAAAFPSNRLTDPPKCAASHLVATGFWEGATTSMAGTIWLTNKGSSPCSLRGYLPITLRTQSGRELSVSVRHAGATLLPKPILHPRSVTLAAGVPQSASFLFQWWDWCGSDPGPPSVHVAISSRASLDVAPVETGFVGTAGCLTPGEHKPSWIALTPVGPASH